MKITVNTKKNIAVGAISVLCPHCGHQGMFIPIGQDVQISADGYIVGHRVCPNLKCNGHVFIVFRGNKLEHAFPPIRIDFNSKDVPEPVRKSFEEALDCHANGCFTAAAIMIRRTLEEICHDRGSVGNNLKERISKLKSKIVLPKDLLEGLDELRILGNDAAHIEAKDYNNISSEELDIAIEFTKEIIKGLYQYSSLLEKIRSLKKDGETS